MSRQLISRLMIAASLITSATLLSPRPAALAFPSQEAQSPGLPRRPWEPGARAAVGPGVQVPPPAPDGTQDLRDMGLLPPLGAGRGGPWRGTGAAHASTWTGPGRCGAWRCAGPACWRRGLRGTCSPGKVGPLVRCSECLQPAVEAPQGGWPARGGAALEH